MALPPRLRVVIVLDGRVRVVMVMRALVVIRGVAADGRIGRAE